MSLTEEQHAVLDYVARVQLENGGDVRGRAIRLGVSDVSPDDAMRALEVLKPRYIVNCGHPAPNESYVLTPLGALTSASGQSVARTVENVLAFFRTSLSRDPNMVRFSFKDLIAAGCTRSVDYHQTHEAIRVFGLHASGSASGADFCYQLPLDVEALLPLRTAWEVATRRAALAAAWGLSGQAAVHREDGRTTEGSPSDARLLLSALDEGRDAVARWPARVSDEAGAGVTRTPRQSGGVMGTRPRVFIGSSVESLAIAYAVQQNLEHDAEVTVWSQGVFELSKGALENLARESATYDFAVFVFSNDDIATMRDVRRAVVRDNVIFETGLFMGVLGTDRVFFVMPRGVADFHLPSDLIGVTPATFLPERSDGNVQAALGPACQQIRDQLKRHGSRAPRPGIPVAAPVAAGPVLSDDEITAVVAEWLRREMLAVLLRPHVPAEIETELRLPKGSLRRVLALAIRRSRRRLRVVVDTESLVQLSEAS